MAAPSCRLQLAGDQPLPHSEFTQLRWAHPSEYETSDRPPPAPPEVWADPWVFNSNTPERIYAASDGVFRLWTSIKFGDKDESGKTQRKGRRAVGVQINDGHIDILTSLPADPGGTTSLPAYIEIPLLAGEYISIWVEQQSGVTLSAVGHSAKDTCVGLSWDRGLP